MAAGPFQANERFGQYTLISPIAIGGMAEVWLAKLDGPQGFQKKVALKRMMSALADQPQFVSLFLDEARLMASLTHPHIAQVYELGERDGAFYVAMEFIDGQTVQHVLRAVTKQNARIPAPLAVQIARDAADALHYAHTKVDDQGLALEVIHRDVSPQNLMVTYEGVPKLLDFGIAKATTRRDATEAGQLRGKLSYMPPEQARGELLDHRADQFALGVTLFEMLTHTRLYPALSDVELFRRLTSSTEPYETPRDRDPSVPDEVSLIVARMMSRRREDRFPTMLDVRDRLTSYLQTVSQTVPGHEALGLFMRAHFPPEARVLATVPQQTPPLVMGQLVDPPPRSTAMWWALGAAAAVGLGLTGWLSFRASAPEPRPLVEVPVVALTTTPAPTPVEPAPEEPVDAGPEPTPPVEDAGVELAVAPAEPPEPQPEPDPEPTTPQRKRRLRRGSLALSTSPWTNVFFRGKKLGETPLTGVQLPVGKHQLLLINDEHKLRTTIEVEIRANETTKMKLKL